MKKYYKICTVDESIACGNYTEHFGVTCELKCPYQRDCANHITAGAYRNEGGMTPDLKVIQNHICCSQSETDFNGELFLNKETLTFNSNIYDCSYDL